MSPEQAAAFINSQVACAIIKALGMNAENAQRIAQGQALAYTEKDYVELINEHGIGYNDVLFTIHNYLPG